ncbi:sulfotransferase 6B1-like [Branchiostoma floridae]|uniref:Sulfotransferase n=1 Tax=Branchiostoma floridae TaxID=7739 RepID=A0A9J7LT35_BRAFL|nr:sulfotransferase 6B1-like [Branchiostoma floridae]
MEHSQLYEYKGVIFYSRMITKDSLDIMPDYTIRDDDIAIVTYPKAGTHWIVEIVNKLLKAAGRTDVDTQDIPLCMEATLPGFSQPGHVILKDQPSPRIVHTHLPRHLAPKMISNPMGKVKVIVVMRNPKDTALSRYHYVPKLQALFGVQADTSWDKHAKDFLDGKIVFGDFYDHVLGWWKMQEDPHFLFLKYEDMRKDLLKAITKTKEFLGISLDDVTTASIAESCTFASLTTAWADSRNKIQRIIGRKGVIGDWKKQFTESQSKAYDAKYRERLEGTGLQFDFE